MILRFIFNFHKEEIDCILMKSMKRLIPVFGIVAGTGVVHAVHNGNIPGNRETYKDPNPNDSKQDAFSQNDGSDSSPDEKRRIVVLILRLTGNVLVESGNALLSMADSIEKIRRD